MLIEIDGSSHNGKFDYDLKRQNFLESQGLTVLRFNDIDVKRDIYTVLMAIEGWIVQNNPLTPLTKGELSVTVHSEKCK